MLRPAAAYIPRSVHPCTLRPKRYLGPQQRLGPQRLCLQRFGMQDLDPQLIGPQRLDPPANNALTCSESSVSNVLT